MNQQFNKHNHTVPNGYNYDKWVADDSKEERAGIVFESHALVVVAYYALLILVLGAEAKAKA